MTIRHPEAEKWRDVIADVAAVKRQGTGRSIELIEVALDQLIHRGVGSRIPALLDLADQPVANGTGPSVGPRSGSNDLGQVVPTLAHRIESGVDATRSAPLGSSSMPPRARCAGVPSDRATNAGQHGSRHE